MSTPSGPPGERNDPNREPSQQGWQAPSQPFSSPQGQRPPGQPGEPFGHEQQQFAPYYRPVPSYYSRPSNASLILILGILGLVVCMPCGIAAWIMGKQTLREMDGGLMNPADRGIANAGMICGIVSVCLVAFAICAYAVVIGLLFAGR